MAFKFNPCRASRGCCNNNCNLFDICGPCPSIPFRYRVSLTGIVPTLFNGDWILTYAIDSYTHVGDGCLYWWQKTIHNSPLDYIQLYYNQATLSSFKHDLHFFSSSAGLGADYIMANENDWSCDSPNELIFSSSNGGTWPSSIIVTPVPESEIPCPTTDSCIPECVQLPSAWQFDLSGMVAACMSTNVNSTWRVLYNDGFCFWSTTEGNISIQASFQTLGSFPAVRKLVFNITELTGSCNRQAVYSRAVSSLSCLGVNELFYETNGINITYTYPPYETNQSSIFIQPL